MKKISGCTPICDYYGHCSNPGSCEFKEPCWDEENQKYISCKFKMKANCYCLEAVNTTDK